MKWVSAPGCVPWESLGQMAAKGCGWDQHLQKAAVWTEWTWVAVSWVTAPAVTVRALELR